MHNQKFKPLLPLVSCLLAVNFCLLSGCRSSSQMSEKSKPVAVHAIWESPVGDKHWKFILLEDGTLSEVLRPDGFHMVLADEGKRIEISDDAFAVYIYGPCTWSFNPEINRLRVVVNIDSFYTKVKDAEFEGGITDEFEGIVSKEGKVWSADWKTTEHYKVFGRDRLIEGGNLIFKRSEKLQ